MCREVSILIYLVFDAQILFIFIIDRGPVDSCKSYTIEVINGDDGMADIGCGVLYGKKYPHCKSEDTGDEAHILGVYVSYGGQDGNDSTEGEDYCIEYGNLTGKDIIFSQHEVAECPQSHCNTEDDKFAMNGQPTELDLFAA